MNKININNVNNIISDNSIHSVTHSSKLNPSSILSLNKKSTRRITSTEQLIRFSPMTNYEPNKKNIDILISESHKIANRKICISRGLENYLKKEKLNNKDKKIGKISYNKEINTENKENLISPRLIKNKTEDKKITLKNNQIDNQVKGNSKENR